MVKEKSPELFLSFDQLMAIGTAYRDIKEYERAMIVWRGLIEASYLEDARVGELLRQRGKTLEGMAYLIDLWRADPNTASIESDFFGLSQVLTQAANRAFTDPNLRRELAAAGITCSELLLQTIRMIQVSSPQSPRNPMADEASLALVRVHRTGRFQVAGPAGRPVRQGLSQEYVPRQLPVQRSALGNFHLGQYDRAVEVAGTIARADRTRTPRLPSSPARTSGRPSISWGRSTTLRRQPGKALEYYRQVADRFSDAAGAIAVVTPARTSRCPRSRWSGLRARPAVADRPEAVNVDRGVRVVSRRVGAVAEDRSP